MGWHPESRFSDIDRPNLYPEQQNRRSKINILNSKIYVSIKMVYIKLDFRQAKISMDSHLMHILTGLQNLMAFWQMGGFS